MFTHPIKQSSWIYFADPWHEQRIRKLLSFFIVFEKQYRHAGLSYTIENLKSTSYAEYE